MPLPLPKLLRRAAPAAATTKTAAAAPPHPQPCLSPATPRFPPGFRIPRYVREGLVLSLFP